MFILIQLFSCNNYDFEKDINAKLSKQEITSGETLEITYDKNNKYETVSTYLTTYDNKVIDYYGDQINSGSIKINRILLNNNIDLNDRHFLKLVFKSGNESIVFEYPVNINNSVFIKSLCSTKDCQTTSGNVIENVPNKLSVSVLGIRAVKYTYYVSTLDNVYTHVHEYTNPVNEDYLEKIIMDSIPSDASSYMGSIRIIAEDAEGNFAETALPFRVVRPMEVKHYGKYELAEVYEPVPVTGCIVGSVGNNVSYSESTSETRQNSLNIVISKSWSDSNSETNSINSAEGLSIGETRSVVNSSSLSTSETNSENQTVSSSSSEGFNSSFSTTDGENWSWSLNESTSEGTTNTNGNSTTIGGSASVSVGVSGEGSLPFLAKASGKVETTVGVNASNTNSESTAVNNTQTNGRVYSTAGTKNETAVYGTAQNTTNSSSLSGSYAVTDSNSSSISQGSTDNSTRVWNMSETIGSGKVVTTGDSESISETIVTSSSSSTTFSYSAFIPRGRTGVFYRQTSRWTKLSEIITYDLNGFPQHAGYITMNTWSWAPELAMGVSCREIPQPSMEEATCYIQPCGE